MKSPSHHKKSTEKRTVNRTLYNEDRGNHHNITPSSCYPVEKIIGIFIGKDKCTHYKVQWSPSWEKEEHLIGCDHLIQQFNIENGNYSDEEYQKSLYPVIGIKEEEVDIVDQKPEEFAWNDKKSLYPVIGIKEEEVDIIVDQKPEEFAYNDQMNGEVNRNVNSSLKFHADSIKTNFAKEQFDVNDGKEILDTNIEDTCADIVVINGYVDIDTRKVTFQEDTKEYYLDSRGKRDDIKTGCIRKTINTAIKDLNSTKMAPCQVVVPKIEADMEYYKKENLFFGSMEDTNSLENSADRASKFVDQSNEIGHHSLICAEKNIFDCKPSTQISKRRNNSNEDKFKSDFHASGSHVFKLLGYKKKFQRNHNLYTCKRMELRNRLVSCNKANKIVESKCILPYEEKPFKCNDCKEIFTTKSQLQQHAKWHNKEGPFKCEKCEESFPTKNVLKQHYLMHRDEKPFKCEECNKRFQYSSSLHRHATVHTGERPYKCSECKKSFKTKSSLQQHATHHSKERPFMCNECGKCFKTKKVSIQHNILHTGERPYKCIKCFKSFQNSSNLLMHGRVHSGERPFECDMCSKRFKTKDALQKHYTLHEKK